ncbi:hypothetical protein BC938DRAFT_475172 [Jimgerdemannia flammicorona]|uniref:Homeobox domain-containing protein n=1 Tax=Jimgerdemannia flammicorona TaxID=994334 RepID=A0A433PZ88_9FUNG|nr:hypothetical protein BC938DRAFT_475172 [Jimgerdemannia flammicorona]
MLATVPYMTHYDSFAHDDDMNDDFETEHGDADSLAYRTVKRRRRLTQEETRILNQVFETTTKPNSQVRKRLAQQLGMTPRAVQIWFQNRRAKQKRDSNESANTETPPPKKLTFASDYYSSKMNQSQDQRDILTSPTGSNNTDESRRSPFELDMSNLGIRRDSGASSNSPSPSPVTAVDEMEFSIFSTSAPQRMTHDNVAQPTNYNYFPVANPRTSAPQPPASRNSFPQRAANMCVSGSTPPCYDDVTSQMDSAMAYDMHQSADFHHVEASLPRLDMGFLKIESTAMNSYGRNRGNQCMYNGDPAQSTTTTQGLEIVPLMSADMFGSSPMTPEEELTMVFPTSETDYSAHFDVLLGTEQVPLLFQGLPSSTANMFNIASSQQEYGFAAPSPQLSSSSTTSNSEPPSPQSSSYNSPYTGTLEHALGASTARRLPMFDPSSTFDDFAAAYHRDMNNQLVHNAKQQRPPIYRSKSTSHITPVPLQNYSTMPLVEILPEDNAHLAHNDALGFDCFDQSSAFVSVHNNPSDDDAATHRRDTSSSSLSEILQYL